MKSYMIPEDLFLELVKYHLLDLQEPERAERIRSGLNQKMEADARRREYAESIAYNYRNPYTFSEEWVGLYAQWERKEISSKEFLKKMGVKPATFYNMVTEYRRLKSRETPSV